MQRAGAGRDVACDGQFAPCGHLRQLRSMHAPREPPGTDHYRVPRDEKPRAGRGRGCAAKGRQACWERRGVQGTGEPAGYRRFCFCFFAGTGWPKGRTLQKRAGAPGRGAAERGRTGGAAAPAILWSFYFLSLTPLRALWVARGGLRGSDAHWQASRPPVSTVPTLSAADGRAACCGSRACFARPLRQWRGLRDLKD